MKEKFKILNEYPAYRVSSMGKIQSRWRWGAYYSGFQCNDIWKNLPLHYTSGYAYVHLCDGKSKPKTVRVHRLIAETFLGKHIGGKLCVRHLDGNPANNAVSNLAWGTYLENENDKIVHGTWNTRNGGAKITPEQVQEIREKLKKDKPQKELADEYGVSRPTITRIANNKIWRIM